jgi:hypothetical protein
MPATSIRDLIVKDDDIAVATHGRGFWILDDIEPLRQARNVQGAAYLFAPQRAWRFRWNKNTDTPLPADEPTGQNPPEGAILDYYLASPAEEVVLEILDATGSVVRSYSSKDKVLSVQDIGNAPRYWLRQERALPTTPGMHRVTWDLHYPPLLEQPPAFPIAAIPHQTTPNLNSPFAMPGTYSVRLRANGQTLTQPLVLEMDPRVKTSTEGLRQQFNESMQVYAWLRAVERARGKKETPALNTAADALRSLLDRLQSADTAPASALSNAVRELGVSVTAALKEAVAP